MQQLSILGALLVSFPEAIIIAMIGILSIGKFSYFENKFNYIRIIIFAIISSILAYLVKSKLSNEEAFLIYIFICSLMFIFIIKLKFYESIMATIFGIVITLALIEVICFLSISAVTGIKIDNTYKDDILLFLIVIPERIIQITLILLSLRFKLKIVDLDSPAMRRKDYYIKLIVYLLSISTLIFLALIMAKILLFDHGDFANSTNTLLLRLNIYVTLFVTTILTLAIRSTNEFYKNKNVLSNNELQQNLQYISNLIDEKRYIDVKESIDTLKEHVAKQ